MRLKTAAGLSRFIGKQLKHLAFIFADKPSQPVEQYTLEHFLLYHALVGSSPENKHFATVRADLMQAFADKSRSSLAIALKLPPLAWEEKLQSIFAELAAYDCQLVIDLLSGPVQDGAAPEPAINPLNSDAWQVRANAAGMLCYLEAKDAAPQLAEALEQCREGELKAAFCHIAYALGRLHTGAALVKYLYDDEPWFRVDAAGALAACSFEQTANDLAQAMLAHHNLSDYMAVAIARGHRALEFIQAGDFICRQAAFEMVIEIVRASSETYPPEIVFQTGTHLCWPYLIAGKEDDFDPRRLRATICLAEYFMDNAGRLAEFLSSAPAMQPASAPADTELLTGASAAEHLLKQAEETMAALSQPAVAGAVLNRLESYITSTPDEPCIRHAVWLTGRLRIKQALPCLLKMLRQGCIDEVIDALGEIGQEQAALDLIQFAKEIVDMDERTARVQSALPVVEPDAQASRRYWLILKALGRIGHPAALEFLTQASLDFAPDKRQQALQSLLSIYRQHPATELKPAVFKCIERGLHDPCAQVRLAALDGVAQLELDDLAGTVLKMCDAREKSIKSQAFSVMCHIAESKRSPAVVDLLTRRLSFELDRNKRKRLEELLDKASLAGNE